MDFDRNGLEVLTRAECMHLLAAGHFGRIALTSQALPLVLPVNYALDGQDIVIRTHPGTKLEAATRHAVVAFEIDDIDPLYHSGWSVVAQGIARAIDSPAEVARLLLLHTATWTPSPAQRFVAISTDIVSGRRIPPRQVAPNDATRATMSG